MAKYSFICKDCGPSEHPCEHAMEAIELKLLRDMEKANRQRFAVMEKQLKEIIHNQNHPPSDTLPDMNEQAEVRILRRIEHDVNEIEHSVKRIEAVLVPKPPLVVAKFIITQGESMPTQEPLPGLAPGATDNFFATPVDSSGGATTLPEGIVPVWTSDDPADVIAPAADGLSAAVTANPAATAGSVHTLTVALPDGSVTSPVPLPITGGGTGQPVASFVISQGAAPPARSVRPARR